MANYKAFSTLLATPMGGRLTETGNDGLALYGEVTLSLTEKFTLAIGARQHDQENYSQSMLPTNQAPLYVNRDFAADPLAGVPNPASPRTLSEFDKPTGRVSAQYQFTDDIMGYVSYAEGFNPGGSGFINRPVTNELIASSWTAETISNAEVGMRADLATGVCDSTPRCSTRGGTTQLRPWQCDSATRMASATAKTRGPLSTRTWV